MLAVTAPAVRLAGLEKTVYMVAAACDPALSATAAVLPAEPLANTGGGAARVKMKMLNLQTIRIIIVRAKLCWGIITCNEIILKVQISKPARTTTFHSASLQSFFSFLVCFLQFAPYFVAGAMHPDGCWQ